MKQKREPRPYQRLGHEAIVSKLGRECQDGMAVLPTGTGKTLVGAMCAATWREQLGGRSLFLVNREVLGEQAEASMAEYGLSVLVERANQRAYKDRIVADPDVVVATVQTLHSSRLMEHWPTDYFAAIITDECHRAGSPGHRRVRRHFSSAFHLGLTATPGGGKWNTVYEKVLYEYKFTQAIKDGYICPPKTIRIPIAIDIKGLTTVRGGDFNAGELSERISPKIEELADGICQYAEDRYGVTFTPDVGCAKSMAEALTAMGRPALYVAGTGGKWGMPRSERKAILRAYARGEFLDLVCCDLLFEGWDCSHVEQVVNCRPTRKLYRWQQMVGRGTRLCHEIGKLYVRVLDFDWRADSGLRSFASSFDMWAGEIDDERVKKRARKKVEEKEAAGEEVDVEKEIDEAKEYFARHDKLMIRLTGRKMRLVGTPFVFDPEGVSKLIGAKLVKRYDIKTERAGAASYAQIEKLRRLGVKDQGEISRWGADKLIRNLEKRQNEDLATPGQLAELTKAGMNEELARTVSAKEAKTWLLDKSFGIR